MPISWPLPPRLYSHQQRGSVHSDVHILLHAVHAHPELPPPPHVMTDDECSNTLLHTGALVGEYAVVFDLGPPHHVVVVRIFYETREDIQRTGTKNLRETNVELRIPMLSVPR